MFESGARKVKSPEIGPSFQKLRRQKPPNRLQFRIAASAQPIFSCLPIEPCPTPFTRSTDADRLLLRLPRNSSPQR